MIDFLIEYWVWIFTSVAITWVGIASYLAVRLQIKSYRRDKETIIETPYLRFCHDPY